MNISDKEKKIIPRRNSFEKGLAKIFSNEPSQLSYKEQIENLINELEVSNDDFLYLTILSLAKIIRNNDDSRIIASYLFSMPNFFKFLKGNNNDKTEQEIFKDLIILSKSITYDKYEKNHIIMRLGDIGTTAYIILKGNADVLLKNFKIMGVTKYDYLYYLANLIKYNEYGLLNEVINENFKIFPIEIDDDYQNNDDIFNINEKTRYYTIDNLEKIPTNKNTKENNFIFSNKMNTEQGVLKINRNQNITNFKLNENNIAIKLYKNPFKISEEKLLELFNLKKINDKHLHCFYQEYINRLQLVNDNYKFYINEKLMRIIENEERKRKENKEKKEEYDINKIYYLKIYSYGKVGSIGKGTLFGELALSQENSLRTATIITSKVCDITILNKKVFNNCLKKGAAIHIKKLLSFFVNLPIFNGITEYFFYNRYYSYLSKKIMARGNILINQGDTPKGIILLHSGTYGISSRISLYSLTKLIFNLIENNLNEKSNDYEETKKYQKLMKAIIKISKKTQLLINENPKFETFYKREINIKVTELSSPDIIGFKEYVNEKGVYSFTIETRSTENIFYILDNKLYSEILHKNITIRKNQKEFQAKKINVMIFRLMILRNCLVNFFLENKIEKINSVISKELDIINDTKIKQKSLLKNKVIEYNFKNNKKELEINNKIMNKNIEEKVDNIEESKINLSNKNNKTNLFSINFLNKTMCDMKNPRYSNRRKDYSKVATLYKTAKKYIIKEKEKKSLLYSKKQIMQKKNNYNNIRIFNKTFKESFHKNKEELQKNSYFNDKTKMKLPRLNSSLISYQKKLGSTGILMNNMVYEEFNKKIKNNLIDKNIKTKDIHLIDSMLTNTFKNKKEERKISPLNPTKYKRIIFQYKNLRKSVSGPLFKRIIKIRPKTINKIMNNKNGNTTKNKPIKINLKIKKIFSPLEISLTKYKENISNDKMSNKSKENKTNKSIIYKKIILNQKLYK